MAFTNIGGGTLVTGIASVHLARLLALRSALNLELLGIRVGRRSIHALVKREFGFTGSKARVLEQLDALINTTKANLAGAQEVQ